MLGRHLQYLRERQGLSRATLAASAGLAEVELARLEEADTERLPTPQLLALATGLRLEHAANFARLVQLNGSVRHFRLYVVGLPKTGTVSLCGLFGRYRTAHEFWQWDTSQQIIACRQGRLTRAGLAEFLLRRDAAACVEVDSAHFNRHYIGLLAELFPEARFIGLLRDPFSWVSSLVNYFTVPEVEALESQELPNGLPFDLPLGASEAKAELIRHFERYADTPISFWADACRTMLKELPAGRTLIVRTHEISQKLNDLAQFAGVPREMLQDNQAHLNHAHYHVSVLQPCDRDKLQARFDAHCADLLAQHFPEFSLAKFLEGP